MLFDKIKKYNNSGVYPFHMPGHKRQAIVPELPYEFDMTEIEGFDNLHDAKDCIKEIEDRATEIYKAKRAFMLLNGATCGIMSAIGALTKRGDRVLIARNCHISVYRALRLFGLKPEYILPQYVKDGEDAYPIFGSVDPDDVYQKLINDHDIKLVVLTSPTYEGVVSDIKKISQICHEFGVKLFVDEAHGAHFPFSDYFPESALKHGADVVVTSLHKTLPALTQTALLLTNDLSLQKKLQYQLSVFQTSSPSYILMCSVEKCLEYVSSRSFYDYVNRLKDFEKRSSGLKNLKLLLRDDTENVFDLDRGKLVISTAHADIGGKQLAESLRQNYGIETEMASDDYVIAMTSLCDSDEGFNRLIDALFCIDEACERVEEYRPKLITKLPQKVYEPYETDFDDEDVAREDFFIYPPGIPLIVSGERIK